MIGVGPDLAGNWHPKVLEALAYAGDWLKVNGEAIYKTRPCKITQEGNVYYLKDTENTVIYAIVEGWPGESLVIDHVSPQRRSDIYLLGYNKPLSWKKNSHGISIKLPAELQSEENRPCKQAFAFKIIGSQL
jgi:alpha-L-fucosidase